MNKLDLDTKIEEIKELVTTPDYDTIDKGVALARELNEPAVFEAMLKDCRYDMDNRVQVGKNAWGPITGIKPLIKNQILYVNTAQ